MIRFLKRAKLTTWISFVIHLLLFGAIAYSGIQKWGYDWKYLLVAVILPIYFLYRNIQDYDK